MKNNRKRIIFTFLFFCFCFSILSFFLTRYEYNKYKENVNCYVYSIITVLQQEYPNITEEEIINIVNQNEHRNYIETFKKYGIKEQDSILYQMEENYQVHLSISVGFTIFITFIFVTYFLLYFYKKERMIREITNYMKEINQRNYKLGISDYGEGELSILRNEVYKTTLMLREESENLKKEKMALKDSISDISHQLKTPLTSILIMLDNILDNPKMEETTKNDFIKNVQHQVENINFLIVSLLKISRLDADVVEFKKENISIEKLIQNTIENVSVLKEVKNVNIEVTNNGGITFVGDYHWELEAITNILKNAIEHSKENGMVKISVQDNPMYTKISIEDEGIGMSKKDLQNIFKRFYKGEESSSDSIGIGLSLAKKIIEKDNGMIKVDSKKGMGTTFEIRYMK